MLLNWTIVFLILAIVAGFFGFSGVSKENAKTAKILCIVFLVLYVASFFIKSKVTFDMHPDEGKVKFEVKPQK
jgi:uncharacterized membrane protein YtjA (UPF0391 family)